MSISVLPNIVNTCFLFLRLQLQKNISNDLGLEYPTTIIVIV